MRANLQSLDHKRQIFYETTAESKKTFINKNLFFLIFFHFSIGFLGQ